MIIYVKTLTGKTISIEAELNDTIAKIKDEIKREENIEIEQQRLLFKNTELDDKQTLNHYGLYSEATIYLVVRMMQQINPNPNPNQNPNLVSKLNASSNTISFIIQIGNDSELTLNMDPNSTIAQVKMEIKNQRAINGEILLSCEGQTLLEGKTLSYYQITSGSTINLTVRLTGGH